ncbi:MAG: hypothetical protein ACTSWN_08545 [Promethearchaeota archaeon]
MAIFIDTEIWVFAQKVPDPSKFQDGADFKKASKFHSEANTFLKQKISETEVCMTYHQLCEIYHTLAFRGIKIPKDFVTKYCNQLLNSQFMRWFQVMESHVKKAVALSVKSGIHIWDYICVLPIQGDVEIFYSCDEHFKHDTFQALGPEIINPLGEWITL